MSALLSLRSRIRQVVDYSPIDRERELGLDRSETVFMGCYYVSLYHCNLKLEILSLKQLMLHYIIEREVATHTNLIAHDFKLG